ncbi:TPA: hypothetical protein GFY00_08915 [Escherichia coli]|nr:hypothetical protein [Escherichia coli]
MYNPGSYEPLVCISTQEREKGSSSSVWYYHTHLNGLPEELTDEEGDIVWRGEYGLWGNLKREEQSGRCPLKQNLRFQGQYFDAETGLHQNIFRYYAPECGRFTQQDPIGLEGGLNLYQYAPNPLSYIDPLGLCPKTDFKWGNPKSKPTYGHTFSEHGQKMKPSQLIDRARNKGHQVGQYLDDNSAADFIASVAKKGPGVHDVPLPTNIKGRGYLPDGTEVRERSSEVHFLY